MSHNFARLLQHLGWTMGASPAPGSRPSGTDGPCSANNCLARADKSSLSNRVNQTSPSGISAPGALNSYTPHAAPGAIPQENAPGLISTCHPYVASIAPASVAKSAFKSQLGIDHNVPNSTVLARPEFLRVNAGSSLISPAIASGRLRSTWVSFAVSRRQDRNETGNHPGPSRRELHRIGIRKRVPPRVRAY